MSIPAKSFTIRQGDADPGIVDTLLGTDGLPFDLTGYAVTLRLLRCSGSAPPGETTNENGANVTILTATVLDQSTHKGQVQITFSTSFAAKSASFKAIWRGTIGGRAISFPNNDEFDFFIREEN